MTAHSGTPSVARPCARRRTARPARRSASLPALLAALLAGLLGAGGVPALAAAQTPESRPAAELSHQQALQLVQSRYGARVVRSELVEQDGRHVFVFRLLSADGKVWTVRIDAHSGAEVR